MKEYHTLQGESIAEYEIQRSRFIAHAKHVESEEDARAYLLQQKKAYFDARHNCSAWVLGAEGDKQKSNDDGEPGGTAGNPILESIKKRALTDVIIVVTRYFGGIKLGASGLIRAYGHTAGLGLDAAEIIAMQPRLRVKVTCDYTMFHSIDHFLRQREITTEDISYTDAVAITLLLPPAEAENILSEITELTAARCKYKRQEEILLPVPVK